MYNFPSRKNFISPNWTNNSTYTLSQSASSYNFPSKFWMNRNEPQWNINRLSSPDNQYTTRSPQQSSPHSQRGLQLSPYDKSNRDLSFYNQQIVNEDRTISDKYCSCIFKVTGRNYRNRYPGSPQAICTSSVINRRGIRGPGKAKCNYTQEYLDRVTESDLYWYAAAKGLIEENRRVSIEELKRRILNFWQEEGNLVNFS